MSEGNTKSIHVKCAFSFLIKHVFFLKLVFTCLDLKSKLVEEVVDEVFDEADDANVQMLACDIMEDNPGCGRRQFVPQSVVFLMAVDGHLKC